MNLRNVTQLEQVLFLSGSNESGTNAAFHLYFPPLPGVPLEF